MISPEKRRNLITMIDNSFRGSSVGIRLTMQKTALFWESRWEQNA